MKIKAVTALALGAVLIAGCQRKMEKMVEVSGHMFVFNYRVATATYLVTLKKTSPIPDGTVAIAEFENPAGGDPIILKEKVFPAWDKITLQSPSLHCVRKDRPYSVNIRLVDAEGTTLQELKTQLVSDVDQSVLPSKPLVVGPLYTQNPEVFKPDGTTDFSNADKCPAV
ncbi:hypothetical protein N2599_04605 [Rhizobium sullae]|uniref:Lipoprotein n=1 Tax=Rhizobium sullae TaxID=50338 RepID=A0A2N0D3C7_RHISU|nr:hypothetical protein [Rhizobium sullae]PKA40552.1 hypothetical protein CWR43_28750 [Rhizobium sullae]UWU15297.1 hypothetical protein N2599_04605 [Rhizobium sullae]